MISRDGSDVDFDLSAYEYELPENLIAQVPVSPRDASRLMVIHRREKRWEHRKFSDLTDYLDSRDLVVANNTRVLKARLVGHRLRSQAGEWIQGGRVEFVMLEELQPLIWEGLFHASGRAVPGFHFEIPTPDALGLRGEVIRGSADSPTGTVVVRFNRDPLESGAGELPLPHYIERHHDEEIQQQDEKSYQTVYAKHLGSAAAPTAGLHFTEDTMKSLKNKGIDWVELTLHVGVGTFRPVKVKDIRQHQMHEERYDVSAETALKITDWKQKGNRVLAVGTTSVRTLESAWDSTLPGGGGLRNGSGKTSIFIRPGQDRPHPFQVVDRLLTNFHLPGSTLLMLVSAFAGRDLVLEAYADAVREKYRFFSYGDAMLII